MNKTNKVRKGEVRIYGGKTYVAIPEIKEDHCAGCCFYNEGCCSIRDFDHIDFPGMDRWEYKNSQYDCFKQSTGYFFCHTISVIFPCQSTN